MKDNLLNIEIFDDESLLKACDVLHDGYCDLSEIEYDHNSGTWKAMFEREYFEDPNMMLFEPKLFFFHKVCFPMAKSELSLEGIKTYNIEDKSKIQIYSFSECQVKNNAYIFFFNEGMEITIKFENKPKGNLVDQELLDKKGSFYKWRNPFIKNQ